MAVRSLDNDLRHELATLDQAGLLRSLRRVDRRTDAVVWWNDRSVVDFCSNDYLGLASDPRLAVAAATASRETPTGAAASRNLTGNYRAHELLEEELANEKGFEAALVFGSGFGANAGAIPALARRGDVIYSDQLNHASIVDGCRLAGAVTKIFPHADLEHLAQLLKSDAGEFRRRWIVVEGVYSMDGDLFPLDRLAALAREENAFLYLDDAHGGGVIGPRGTGSWEHWGLSGHADVTVGTLGKAYGVAGAYVGGSRTLREYLVNRARSFIFTTGSSPLLAMVAREALRIARAEPWRRDKLRENAARLRASLEAGGFPVPGNLAGHIVPIMVGDASHTMDLSRRLVDRGFVVGAVRYPTVPEGTARLRLTLSAAHSFDQIEALAKTLGELFRR